MGSTRDFVLEHLRTAQRCTINDLAEAVKINPVSVRHHISRMQAQGLVDSAEERHGVGRPRRVYFLTQAGREHFPAHTIRFTNSLLAELKEQLPAETYDKIFTRMAESISEKYAGSELETMDIPQRLSLLEECLSNEGFSVQIEQTVDEIIIKETGCPYYHVGQTHREVCAIDKALISKILAAEPQRSSCLLSGDSHCTYVVPLAAVEQTTSSS